MAEGESSNGPDTGGPQSPGTERGSDEGQIQTFLIADVRGYTLFSQEHGDESAGRLAAHFANVTTQVVEAGGGTVLELRGDEALCTFSTTRRAIRSAISLQQRYLSETESDPALPLPVGIGIDTGEAVPVEGGFRGRALNLAARLCGVARAGEILATREALHIAGQMDGIHVEDRGPSSFKNIPEPVGVFRVFAAGADPARWFAEHPISPPISVSRETLTRKWVVSAGLTAALLALVAVVLLRDGDHRSRSSVNPNSLVRIDANTGQIVANVDVEVPGLSQLAAVPPDAVWVPSPTHQLISVVDTSTNATAQAAGGFGGQIASSPVSHPGNRGLVSGSRGIAYGQGSVWVTGDDSSVTEFAPTTGQPLLWKGRLPGGASLVAVDDNHVWVAMDVSHKLYGIDPLTHDVVLEGEIGLGPNGIAVGEGAVWVSNAIDGTVSKINRRSGDTMDTIDVGVDQVVGGVHTATNGFPSGIGIGFRDVWVSDYLLGVVYRIDPATDSIYETISVGPGLGSDMGATQTMWSCIASAGNSMWVTNPRNKTIVQIDPTTNTVENTIHVPYTPACLIGVGDDVWVVIRQ